MEKLITVKGMGHATAKPDLVVLSLGLETTSLDYDQCMKLSGERDELIKAAVVKSGLPKDSVKTSNFGISSEYSSIMDKNGNYRSVFDCWKWMNDVSGMWQRRPDKTREPIPAHCSRRCWKRRTSRWCERNATKPMRRRRPQGQRFSLAVIFMGAQTT